MKSRFMDTILSHSGACDLTKSVNIKTINVKDIFNLFPHFFRPRFCAVNTDFQIQPVNNPCFLNGFCKIQSIRRRTRKCSGSKIFHTHHLTLCIACRHRNRHCPERSCSKIQSKASGKQTITITDMYNIFLGKSCHRQFSCHTFPPYFYIFLRIRSNRQFSCCTGCSLHTDNILFRYCQKSKRIIFP